MPFVLAPELAAIFVAVLLAMLCMGVYYLIRAIAAALPNIHFLFIHVDFGKIFSAIVDPVASWLVHAAQNLFSTVEHWLHAIGYMIVQLLFGTVQTTVTHAHQITHLHNVTIPDERIAAEKAAAAYTNLTVQGVRAQIHLAQTTWEQAHTYADAVAYIDLERSAPSVEHAILAGLGRTLIASENHAQDLHDQLKAYVNAQVAEAITTANAYAAAQVRPIERAIAIPNYGTAAPPYNVEDVKNGVITGVGTAVAVIAYEFVKCAVRNCEGNNNFHNLLNDALGLVGLAAFGEFLKQAIDSPATADTEYAAVFRGLLGTGETAFHDLLAL